MTFDADDKEADATLSNLSLLNSSGIYVAEGAIPKNGELKAFIADADSNGAARCIAKFATIELS